jgi:hypothetical protein
VYGQYRKLTLSQFQRAYGAECLYLQYVPWWSSKCLSALALFVTWFCTDHANNTVAADNFTVAAQFLDRSRNSHFLLLKNATQKGQSSLD